MAHTAGPWTFRKRGVLASHPFIVESEEAFIADVIEDRDTIDNARLIAAAPRMFDYISAKAKAGDSEAVSILEAIHGNS